MGRPGGLLVAGGGRGGADQAVPTRFVRSRLLDLRHDESSQVSGAWGEMTRRSKDARAVRAEHLAPFLSRALGNTPNQGVFISPLIIPFEDWSGLMGRVLDLGCERDSGAASEVQIIGFSEEEEKEEDDEEEEVVTSIFSAELLEPE